MKTPKKEFMGDIVNTTSKNLIKMGKLGTDNIMKMVGKKDSLGEYGRARLGSSNGNELDDDEPGWQSHGEAFGEESLTEELDGDVNINDSVKSSPPEKIDLAKSILSERISCFGYNPDWLQRFATIEW